MRARWLARPLMWIVYCFRNWCNIAIPCTGPLAPVGAVGRPARCSGMPPFCRLAAPLLCKSLINFVHMTFILMRLPARQGNELPGQEKCSADSYVILPHKSKYVDQQTLKLQVRSSVAASCKQRTLAACLHFCTSRC